MSATRYLLVHGLLLVGGLLLPAAAAAQAPLLRITSPKAGAIVTEGQTVTVTVAADSSLRHVSVIAEQPLPSPQSTAKADRFAWTIPTTVPPGSYSLTAVGAGANGLVQSEPITIDVEPRFPAASLACDPSLLAFDAVGGSLRIRVLGTFPDGSTLDLTSSSQVTYTSRSPAVATVDKTGLVTAVAPGQAFVLVTAGSVLSPVYAVVVVRVRSRVPGPRRR